LLKGRVIEEGMVRDVPIELPVPKAIDYLGYEGRFCAAHVENGKLTRGPEILSDSNESQPITITGDTGLSLSDLPETS